MFTNRKSGSKQTDQWCVILNPIKSELSKAETVEKIVEIFPLSIEEAAQLVDRTPIILLENLSYEQAHKVKELFSSVNADILVTDDTFQRRKCYRTVWPQDPMLKLAGIKQRDTAQSSLFSKAILREEKLSKEIALKHIREEKDTETQLRGRLKEYEDVLKEKETAFGSEQQEKEKLAREVQQLKKEIYTFKRNEGLLEKTNNEFEYLSLELEKTKSALDTKSQELKKVKEVLQNTRQTSGPRQEHAASESVRAGQIEEVHKLKGENKKMRVLVEDLQRDNEELQRVQVAYNEFKNKYEYLENEIRGFAAERSSFDDLREKYTRVCTQLHDKEKELARREKVLGDQQSELQRLKAGIESKHGVGEQTSKDVQTHIKQLARDLKVKDETIAQLQVEGSRLKIMLEDLQRDHETREQMERNYESLERTYQTLQAEVAGKGNIVDDHEKKIAMKDDKIKHLSEQLEKNVYAKREENMRLQTHVKTLTEELAFEQSAMRRLEADKEKLKALLRDLQNDNEQLRQGRTHFDNLEDRYLYLEGELNDYAVTKEKLGDLQITYEELKKQYAQKERGFQNQNKVYQTELTKSEDELNRTREELETVESERSELVQERDALGEKYEKLQQDFAEKELNLQNQNRTYQSEITQRDEDICSMRDRIETLEKEGATVSERVQEQEGVYEELKQQYTQKEREVLNQNRAYQSEIMKLEDEVSSMREKMEAMESEKALMDEEIGDLRTQRGELISQYEEKEHDLENQHKAYQLEISQVEDDLSEMRTKIESLESEKQDLSLRKDNTEKTYKELQEQYQQKDNDWQNECEQNKKYAAQIAHLRDDFKKLQDEMNVLQTESGAVAQQKDALQKAYDELQAAYKQKEQELRNVSARYTERQSEIKKLEDTLHPLRENFKKAATEKEEMVGQIRDLKIEKERLGDIEDAHNALRKKFVALKGDFDKYRNTKERLIHEQDNLIIEQQHRIEDIDKKCRKLVEHTEMQQKTIKELTAQREEVEAMQRRIRVQQDVAYKENLLRDLVKKQEGFEQEIIERERKIKDVLGQQEVFEKELVQLKQEQKHLIEKNKLKEKQRIPKASSSRISIVAPKDEVKDAPQKTTKEVAKSPAKKELPLS